jgi:hypothetical protein
MTEFNGGARDGEEWCVEIEHDCLDEERGFVVAVWTTNAKDDRTLVELTAAGAREIAATLCVEACACEVANRRRASATP